MILFKTTQEEINKLDSFILKMKEANVDISIIEKGYELAKTDQGVYDLFSLWIEAENDYEERNQIISDIQRAIKDYQKHE